jgi:hypothetical protein
VRELSLLLSWEAFLERRSWPFLLRDLLPLVLVVL